MIIIGTITIFCALLLCGGLAPEHSTDVLLWKLIYELLDTLSLVVSELVSLRFETAFHILCEDAVRIDQLVIEYTDEVANNMIYLPLPTAETTLYLATRILVAIQATVYLILNFTGFYIFYKMLMNEPVAGKVIALYVASVSTSDKTRHSRQALGLILASILPDWLQQIAVYCVQHPGWLSETFTRPANVLVVVIPQEPDLGSQSMIPGNRDR